MGFIVNRDVDNLLRVAAERADMLVVDPTSGDTLVSDFANPVGLLYFFNYELAAIWDAMIASYEDWCIQHHPVGIVAGIENYSMPTDFYKLRKVFPLISGRRGTALKRFDLQDLGEADSTAALITSPLEDSRYKLTGNRLWIHPMPTAAGTLEAWYVPTFRPVENIKDTIDFRMPFGWEDYVIEGLAARMLEKEESDSSHCRREQQRILQRILTMSEDRDVGEPHKMIDTEG